jgi:hypothetical protein
LEQSGSKKDKLIPYRFPVLVDFPGKKIEHHLKGKPRLVFRREFPKIVVPSSKIVSFNPWFSLDFIAFLTNERCFDQNNSPRFDCLNPKKSGFPQICSIFGVEHPLLKLWDFKSWMVPDAHHFPCFGAFSPGITFQTTSKKQQNLDFFGCFHVFPKKNVWISSDFSQEIWIFLGIFRHFRCLSGALSYRGSKVLSVVGEVADVRLHGGPSAVGGL